MSGENGAVHDHCTVSVKARRTASRRRPLATSTSIAPHPIAAPLTRSLGCPTLARYKPSTSTSGFRDGQHHPLRISEGPPLPLRYRKPDRTEGEKRGFTDCSVFFDEADRPKRSILALSDVVRRHLQTAIFGSPNQECAQQGGKNADCVV